jgi:hypothetical protein
MDNSTNRTNGQESTTKAQPAPIPSAETKNFTMVHHVAFRRWMAVLSPEAWEALCTVIDRTWGYQEQEAPISLSDFKRYMGVPPSQDVVVYRALRELFFFHLIGEGKKGLRGEKSYFVTENLLTTNVALVVRESKIYIQLKFGTNVGLVELLTLRKVIYYPPVSSPTNAPLVLKEWLTVYETAPEDAPRKSKQEAKYTSLNTSFKDKGKDIPVFAPNVAKTGACPVENLEEEKETKGRKDEDFKGEEETESPDLRAMRQRLASGTLSPQDEISLQKDIRFRENYERREAKLKQEANTSPLQTRASEAAASERRELPKQSTEQAKQDADEAPTRPVPAISREEIAQRTKALANSADFHARYSPGIKQESQATENEQNSAAPLPDEARTILREAATRPDNITELHPPKKKGSTLETYRAYIKEQRTKLKELEERAANGGYWLEEYRIKPIKETIANYEKAVRALENGIGVDLASQIAQGKMALLPEAIQQQVQMYIS